MPGDDGPHPGVVVDDENLPAAGQRRIHRGLLRRRPAATPRPAPMVPHLRRGGQSSAAGDGVRRPRPSA
ncbi:hypothetical protein EIY87_35295 [Amycolatopsis eburnea]|uniref:Uncharacterized protein n=1 Tax=Amycolatopsis eburnea TaxID=2267691 RepID=A0A427T2G1_9PSEU|nr:hypothetical protein EIY87_35295 [Amycolatopsis eburnea]